ncbi:MAG: ATP-binding cassette domain-containing protein, partial [Salibacteraceae bacterium]
MNYLSVEGVGKSYGERTLFADITFGLSKGQKMALVARNGTGKTTLMRLLARLEAPDTGEVVFRKDLQVGFLDQEPALPGEKTIAEVLYEANNERAIALREYEELIARNEEGEALHKALEKIERLNACDYEARSKEILGKLAIFDTTRKVGILSGGQRKRVALAKLLIDSPDLLVLDDPTYHLDIPMVEWMENYLAKDHLTVFMETHDRYFLDR